MSFSVKATNKLSGSITLPASKSYSIRAFFVAACGGTSTIINPSDCDDAIVAMRVARALGAKVTRHGERFVVKAGSPGGRGKLKIDVGESGTSLRFVLPLLPFFCEQAVVAGKGTLVGRPNAMLNSSLRKSGLRIKGEGPKESVPITYSGGRPDMSRVEIDGSLSSQFISAILIAAPLSGQKVRVRVTGSQMVSEDYIEMTRQILKPAGIRVVRKSAREFQIAASQRYRGLKKFQVPSDWGLAAFFMVAGALVASDIRLNGYFNDRLVQSDGAIRGFLKKMGLKGQQTSKALKIKGPQQLKGGTFSLKDCPDLVPIMAVAAMFAKGTTRLTDIHHARAKESDRISDLRNELLKVGARIDEKPGELIIHPQPSYRSNVELDPHHDHRLAMAFAVLGLRVGVRIRDIACTHKSYPGFVRDLKQLMRVNSQRSTVNS